MKKSVKFLIAGAIALTTIVGAKAEQTKILTAKDYIYMIVHHPNELNKPTNNLDEAFRDLERFIDRKNERYRYDERRVKPPKKMTNFMNAVSLIKVPEAIKLAVESGVDVNEKDGLGRTALNFVAKNNLNAVGVLDVLIKNTKNINNQGKMQVNRSGEDVLIDGNTPLLDAIAANQSKQFIKHLIDAGANVNIVVDSKSPLSLAAANGRTDILEILLEKGAKIGPKAKEKIAWNDGHDESILKDYKKFDFENITHNDKHKYMDAASVIRDVENAPYIKHQVEFVKEDLFKLHGQQINEWLSSHHYKDKYGLLGQAEDFLLFDNFAKSALTGGKDHKEDKMIAQYYFAKNSLNMPTMDKVFIGDIETGTKTMSAPDDHCQKLLDKENEIFDAELNCESRVMRSTNILTPAHAEALKDCIFIQQNARLNHENRVREISKNCRHVDKELSYSKRKDGVLAYMLDDAPVILLPIEGGKLTYHRSLDSIPYSRILEEISNQYGGSHKTVYTDNLKACKNTHMHIIYGTGDWDLIIRVQFKNDEKISANSVPIAIEKFFMNTKAIENKMEQELSNISTDDKEIEEQKEYFYKEQKNKESRIQSFEL